MTCPNCGVPCVGCAGAKITTASDGKTVCTKCIAAYEISKGNNPNTGHLSPNNFTGTAPVLTSIIYNNLNT